MDEDLIDEIKNGYKKEPTMKMRLQFSCKDLKLPGGDFDPMVVLFKCEKNFSSPKEVFKTEAVADDANP